MLQIGEVVDNKYRILHEIGKGGMSHVYLAINEAANKEWAIKEVEKNTRINGDEVRQKPMTETALMKKLRHEHLPEITDVLETDDAYLIVMDYIEGRTLKQILREDGAQKQEDVINWSIKLCDILRYLHERDVPIIYRDMKPGNVMLKPDGNVMLIDFGAAREYKKDAAGDTSCLGTKGYAAPEQYGGAGQTDERTDIYNLGATMYHLVTGKDPTRPPYEMRPIRQWDQSLSTGLEEIIRRCTQNDPDKRYQTARELMYALRHYREMEYGYRQTKKKQYRLFVASCIISAVCLAGAFVMGVYAKRDARNTYEAYLREGQTAIGQKQQIEAYEKAIRTAPQREEAYSRLLNDVMLSDGEFTQDEANELTRIMGYRKNASDKTAEEQFSANKKGYEKFCYDMGLAFFYYYGDSGNRQLSRPWFEIAKESDTLDPAQKSRAERFYKIAEYYARLGDKNRSGDSVISYEDYWNDLLTVSRGDIAAEDNIRTALVIYRELAYQIGARAVEFRAAGVTEDEMRSQLKMIGTAMKENEPVMNEGDFAIAEEIRANIASAERSVDAVYSE